jgi:hypothetical protein
VNDTCLTDEQILRLADGDVAPNQAAKLEDHLAQCARCRAAQSLLETTLGHLRAPLVEVDVKASVTALAAKLAAGGALADRGPRSRMPLLAGAGAALMAAAVMLVALRPGASRLDRGELTARGRASSPSLSRSVGFSVYADNDRIVNGATVSSATVYRGSYRNFVGVPVYALVFAVDAAGEVHWLYPSYDQPGGDPTSVVLPPTNAASPETRLAESVVLEAPVLGPLRVVTVLTTSPVAVSQIESQRADDLSSGALRSRWPEAVVRETDLVVSEEKP